MEQQPHESGPGECGFVCVNWIVVRIAYLVAERIEDFSRLQALPAFSALERDIREAVRVGTAP